ncbi:hypothetical protein [Aquipseudomonas alcaligenes]|nr:hypothetical protein [Pseudomonas alcaligenes]
MYQVISVMYQIRNGYDQKAETQEWDPRLHSADPHHKEWLSSLSGKSGLRSAVDCQGMSDSARSGAHSAGSHRQGATRQGELLKDMIERYLEEYERIRPAALVVPIFQTEI